MSKVDYADYHILTSEVSPPAANTLGAFKIVINDEDGQAGSEFGDMEPIWVYGKVGYKSDRIMRGVMDRKMQVQLRGDQQGLQIAGRSWGAYLDIRAITTKTIASGEIRDIIINTLSPLVPELNFGNYIFSTGVSLDSYTMPRGASVWSLLKELAGLASTPSTQWGVWDCEGSHAGENGVPNVHFGPIKQETSLIPIVNLKYVYRTMSPLDYRSITTRAIIGYDDGCFSDDTEVLTDNGWKLFNDLVPEDKVGTVTEDGHLEYHKPYNYVKYYYKGKMFHSLTKKVDLLVTPNHDMYIKTAGQIKKDKTGTLGFKRVNVSVLPKVYQYKRDAKWRGTDQDTININGLTFPTDTWLRFLGIWLAEGHVESGSNHRIGITQVNQENMDIIERWVKETGLPYTRRKNEIRTLSSLQSKLLHQYLQQFGKAEDKFIPKEIKNLPPERLRMLLDAMMLGDGWHRKQPSKYEQMGYGTISKRLAGDVQEIAIKAGYCANVCFQKRPRVKGLYAHDIYLVYITSFINPTMPYDGKRSEPNHEWVDYEGFVYDVTVDNHTLLVRRNGKAVWSGNSPNTFLPNNFVTVNANGPGVDSTYSGSFNGTTSYVSFPDTYLYPHNITSNGGASIDTAQSKFGGASGKFVAASLQYLSTPDSNDWFFGSGDFTIDFWIKFNSLPASGNVVGLWYQVQDNSNKIEIGLSNSGGTYYWRVFHRAGGVTGPSFTEASPGLSTGVWYHVALVKDAGVYYWYQNGTLCVSGFADSTSLGDFSVSPIIASGFQDTDLYLDGWLDEFRVSKGVARWTANFTPPTAPYATDDYTVLLLHMDGASAGTSFYDSAYPTLNFPTGDAITLEAWIYPTSVTGNRCIVEKGPSADATHFNYMLRTNGTEVEFLFRNSADTKTPTLTTSGAALAVNNWYHVLVAHTYGNPLNSYILVNGVKQTASWTVGNGYDVPYLLAANSVYVGDLSNANSMFFSGYIDNLYVWPRFVGIDEAKQHYKGTFNRGAPVLSVDFEEGTGSVVSDKSGYNFKGTGTNLSWFKYGNVPSSQAKYGIAAQYFDRSFAGLTEATNFANLVLRNARDAIRYVEAELPLDLRLRAGQWVYVQDKAYRGRAILDSVTHIFDEDPRTKAVLIYI